MTPEAVPYGRKTQKPSPVSDVHIVWMTSGLGCDGDSRAGRGGDADSTARRLGLEFDGAAPRADFSGAERREDFRRRR